MASRRDFLGGALLGGAGLIAGRSSASAQPSTSESASRSDPVDALREAVRRGRQLRLGEITQLEWQDQVERILGGCDPEALARAVDLPALRRRARPVARGASILRAPLFASLDADEGADVKVFFLRAGRSDPPHCHFNLVAAHIVLQGDFRVRHYDRMEEDGELIALRPTRDRTIGPGRVTSISDDRDNAHWHLAQTDGVLLDVQQGRIDPSLPIRRRQMLDIDAAESRSDGALLARKLTRGAALRRYG